MSNFQEDYSNLRNLLARNHELVRRLPQNPRNFVCIAGSGLGDNYMSVVKRIRIEGEATNTSTNNYVSLIVKRKVSNKARRERFRLSEIFTNEIYAYNHLVPYIKKHMVSAEDLLFPECYYGGQDQNKELIIVLEDLKENGFSLFNRQIDMDLDVCKAVVMQIARLHAASLVACVKDSTGFHRLRQKLFDVVYSEKAEPSYAKVLESSLTTVLTSLKMSNTDGTLTEPIGQLELLHGKVFKCMRNCVLRADKVHSVICHGDLWVNNIMVKMCNEQIGIKFVDLQAMRYGSPVCDILHVLYTGTRRELREQHTGTILETYSTTLAKILDEMLPEEDIALKTLKNTYSLCNITREYNRSLAYGLGVSMWILPACTFDPQNIPNLDNNSDSDDQNILTMLTERYRVRIKETVLEFHENGYLTSLIDDFERSEEI